MARNLFIDFPKNWDLTLNGVSYGVFVGDNEEAGIVDATGHGGPSSTINLICMWDDRWDLIAGLVGTVDYVGNTIVRTPPATYPWSAEQIANGILPSRLFCTSVSQVKGRKAWRDDAGENVGLPFWLGYAYAILQCEFTAPPYLIEPIDGTAFDD